MEVHMDNEKNKEVNKLCNILGCQSYSEYILKTNEEMQQITTKSINVTIIVNE